MPGQITIKEALELPNVVFIDVRSPGEYRRGSIPGSINVPLFYDEEREIIGLVYRKDEQQARLKGLSLAAPKLPGIIEKIKALSLENPRLILLERRDAQPKHTKCPGDAGYPRL